MLQDEIQCEVEWRPRENGFKPENTTHSNKEIRARYPEMLIDFYERRINVKRPSQGANRQ